MFKQLLLQLILILLNAFFAATEIAVISLNEKKVRAQAEDGDKKAAKNSACHDPKKQDNRRRFSGKSSRI